MAKVFIGNLSDDAKGSDVEDFFRKYGRLREITLKNGFGKFDMIRVNSLDFHFRIEPFRIKNTRKSYVGIILGFLRGSQKP